MACPWHAPGPRSLLPLPLVSEGLQMEGPTWRSCRPPAKLPGPVGSAFQFTGLPMLLSVPVILRFPLFEVALGSDALFLPISLVPAHPGTRPLRGAWSAALAPGPPPSLGALAPDVWAMPPQDSLPGLPLQSSHCTRCSLCYLLGPLPKGRSANFCCSGGRGGRLPGGHTQGLLLSLPLPAS